MIRSRLGLLLGLGSEKEKGRDKTERDREDREIGGDRERQASAR